MNIHWTHCFNSCSHRRSFSRLTYTHMFIAAITSRSVYAFKFCLDNVQWLFTQYRHYNIRLFSRPNIPIAIILYWKGHTFWSRTCTTKPGKFIDTHTHTQLHTSNCRNSYLSNQSYKKTKQTDIERVEGDDGIARHYRQQLTELFFDLVALSLSN